MSMPMPLLDRLKRGEFPRLEYMRSAVARLKKQNELSQALNEEGRITVASEIIKQDYRKGERK